MTAPFKISPHHAYPAMNWHDLQAEIRREIAYRRQAYPGMINKGQITDHDARYQREIFEAILEDCGRFQQAMAPIEEGKPCLNPLSLPRRHSFTWYQRRAAITRELDYRNRFYPERISKGQLSREDADRQLQRLTCMRALYELGYDWTPSNGDRPHFASLTPTGAELDAREQWQIIETEIAQRDHQTQETLAL